MEKLNVRRMVEGKLSRPELQEVISAPKDPGRYHMTNAVWQELLDWDDKIVMRLGEHLFIVRRDSQHFVRCDCGEEFGDYRSNWKRHSRVYLRDSDEAMEEIYPRLMHADPSWMVLREFYCPNCLSLLEVEAVPPGYPVLHDFVPDLEGLAEWVGGT